LLERIEIENEMAKNLTDFQKFIYVDINKQKRPPRGTKDTGRKLNQCLSNLKI
jgi:hypothetical protein